MSRQHARRREPPDFLELVADLIDAQAEERLAVYKDGWDAGYARGLEDGLRQLLDDARLALGRAA